MHDLGTQFNDGHVLRLLEPLSSIPRTPGIKSNSNSAVRLMGTFIS